MKLGILIVYFVRPKLNWFIKLQLRQIRQNTKGVDYQIFAVPLRLHPTTLSILENHPRVSLIESDAERIGNPSREHSHYLDQLVRSAANSGCTHFVTLDADSFPIKSGWVEQLSVQLTEQTPLAAVFRAENQDVCLPHPSGLMCRMDFFEKYEPSFFPCEQDREELEAFSRATGQRIDSGIGYAIGLQKNGLDWIRLYRSNAVDVHPVLSGIYGDVFYHLGAMGRRPQTYSDWAASYFRLFIFRNRRLPPFRPVHRRLVKKITNRNEKIQATILENLRTDPEKYFDVLSGVSNS